jgi:hypothetical protein
MSLPYPICAYRCSLAEYEAANGRNGKEKPPDDNPGVKVFRLHG